MILERLELERVRRFCPGFSCSFAPGLNAVLGPNESGKSTVFDALKAALFLDPKSTREEVRSLYAWAEEGSPFTLRLYIREGGLRYGLWKDFERKEVLLEEKPTGQVWTDVKAVHRKLSELLGLGSVELFSASAAVAQGRLVLPQRGKDRRALDEALGEVMTGGGNQGGAARALELLSRDIQRLTVGLKDRAYKTPGPIRSAEERLGSLFGRRHKVAASCARRASSLQELASAERELGEVDEALDGKQALMEVEAERREIEGSLEEARKRHEEVDRRLRALEENARRRKAAEQKLEGLGPASELEDEDIHALRAALARRDSLAEPLKEARRAVEGAAVPGPGLALALAALGVAGPIIAGFASPWAALKVASAALGFLALAVAAWLWYRRRARLEALEERRFEARRSEADLEEVESRVRELVERGGGGEPEGVVGKALEADRCREEIEKLSVERKALLGGRPEEALESERAELVRRLAVSEERLREERFRGPALDAERYQGLRAEVDSLRVRRDELTKRIERLRGTLETSADEAEELAELDEAIEAAEREHSRWMERLRARQLAKEALEEAKREALEPARGRFQETLGRYMEEISRGRYGAVRTGESMVDLGVRGPEREDFIGPEYLSFGTAEQLLLAARLAFTELLAAPRKPPLLLDEPFGAFDEERLRAAMGLLASIAEERQVIVFTHQGSVASACDHVIELPPPASAL